MGAKSTSLALGIGAIALIDLVRRLRKRLISNPTTSPTASELSASDLGGRGIEVQLPGQSVPTAEEVSGLIETAKRIESKERRRKWRTIIESAGMLSLGFVIAGFLWELAAAQAGDSPVKSGDFADLVTSGAARFGQYAVDNGLGISLTLLGVIAALAVAVSATQSTGRVGPLEAAVRSNWLETLESAPLALASIMLVVCFGAALAIRGGDEAVVVLLLLIIFSVGAFVATSVGRFAQDLVRQLTDESHLRDLNQAATFIRSARLRRAPAVRTQTLSFCVWALVVAVLVAFLNPYESVLNVLLLLAVLGVWGLLGVGLVWASAGIASASMDSWAFRQSGWFWPLRAYASFLFSAILLLCLHGAFVVYMSEVPGITESLLLMFSLSGAIWFLVAMWGLCPRWTRVNRELRRTAAPGPFALFGFSHELQGRIVRFKSELESRKRRNMLETPVALTPTARR